MFFGFSSKITINLTDSNWSDWSKCLWLPCQRRLNYHANRLLKLIYKYDLDFEWSIVGAAAAVVVVVDDVPLDAVVGMNYAAAAAVAVD